MTFENLYAGARQNTPGRYGGSRLTFRDAPQLPNVPHCVVLGGTETYGKFVPAPYPSLLEAATGVPTINLGCLNAGPDAFINDSGLLESCRAATLRIVQIMGAGNLTNSFYAVHPRRNDRFIAARPALRDLFPEVDFAQFSFTRHLLKSLRDVSRERFATIARKLRETWTQRMQALLAQLGGPTMLLWAADRSPDAQTPDNLNDEPLLVNRQMLDGLADSAAGTTEVIISPDARERGTEGMIFAPIEIHAARMMPCPAEHGEIAAAAAPEVRRLLEGAAGPP